VACGALAGAVGGALGDLADVAAGNKEFSWSGLAVSAGVGALVGAAGGGLGGVAGAVGSRLAGTAVGRVVAGAGARLASTSVGRGAAAVGRVGNAALSPARSAGTRAGTSARSLLRTGGNRASTTTQGAAGSGVAARNYKYGDLTEFNALGITDTRTGEITIQQGLTGREFEETLRHETVHSVLTPKNRFLNNARGLLYANSNIWRGTEEAAAETYATRSLARGLAFPIKRGYLDLKGAVNDTLFLGPIGVVGYRVYRGRS
jgi:hypothetical protein